MAGSSNKTISWSSLLESVKIALKGHKVDKEELSRLMSSYESHEADWKQHVFFDEKCFTKNLVDMGKGHYNLIVMGWNPSQRTNIHNHSESSCFAKILSGALREIRYERPEFGKDVKEIGNYLRERNEVMYMDDSMGVHEMINESANQAVSLHLYIPPIDACYTYDRETGEKTENTLTFTRILGVPHEDHHHRKTLC